MSTQPQWRFALLTFGCKINQYESQALREAWTNFGGLEVPYKVLSLKAEQSTAEPASKNVLTEFTSISTLSSAPVAIKDSSTLPHIVILNTCAVTAKAVADVRQTVFRIRRTCPNMAIALIGCAVSAEQELARALPEVDCIVPQAQKATLLQNPLMLLDAIRCQKFQDARKACIPIQNMAIQNVQAISDMNTAVFSGNDTPVFSDNDTAAFPSFSISTFARARPILKVQDGCAQGCTYCIVPLARGRSRSRPFDAILAEAERLLQSGAREIMISGINLREYHARPDTKPQNNAPKNNAPKNNAPKNNMPKNNISGDGILLGDVSQGSASFWGMLKRLDTALAPAWQGLARLRISSLDPAQLDDEGVDTLANTRLVCPHVHLSLQSGSPAVLRRMGRTHYKPERILEAVESLAQHWPLMGLGADLLMGFAGEDQNALEESLALVAALPLTYAHVFAYSERPGTAAVHFTDHLPKTLRQEHARQMRDCVAQKRQAFLERMLQVPCLLVAPDGANSLKGVDAYYIPCHLETDSKPFVGKGLQAVRPVKYAKEGLVVTTIME